jgi:hypothetical protein
MGFHAIYSLIVTLECNRALFCKTLEIKWVFVTDNYWKKSIIDQKALFKAVNAEI